MAAAVAGRDFSSRSGAGGKWQRPTDKRQRSSSGLEDGEEKAEYTFLNQKDRLDRMSGASKVT